jgi:hypothetical protein
LADIAQALNALQGARLRFFIPVGARSGTGFACVHWFSQTGAIAVDELFKGELSKIDQALDELLVNLGTMVLRLSSKEVTKTAEERRALARSVNQYSVCAARSGDLRVQRLKYELEEASKPQLQLVASR